MTQAVSSSEKTAAFHRGGLGGRVECVLGTWLEYEAGRGGLSWIESMEDPRGRRVRAEEGVSEVV